MKKQALIMVAAIAVLGVVALIAFSTGQKKQVQRQLAQPFLGQFKVKDIKSININDTVTLSLTDKTWSYMTREEVNSPLVPKPTRQDHAQKLLDTIENFKKGRLIEKEPTDLSKYNLHADGDAKTLILYGSNEEELMKVRIGKLLGETIANFAQFDEDPEVYRVDDSLMHYINQNDKYWLDLRLFPQGVSQDNLASISITKKDEETIFFEKEKDLWKNPNDSSLKISDDAINSYLIDLENIKATNFDTPQLKDELENGKITIRYTDNTEVMLTLYYFANKYYTSTVGGQDNEIGFLKEYSVNKLFPKADIFIDTSVAEDEMDSEDDSSEDSNN